jgi:hypothetical protein
MTAPMAVPHEAGPIQQEWLRLATGTADPPGFALAMIADLPEPAQRWLSHAITPGTPLWQTAELTMHGQIRLGQWRPFMAHQIIAMPRGYIWAATARVAGLPVTGFDRLSSGTAVARAMRQPPGAGSGGGLPISSMRPSATSSRTAITMVTATVGRPQKTKIKAASATAAMRSPCRCA